MPGNDPARAQRFLSGGTVNPAKVKLLIVEDQVDLAENLAEFFKDSRYELDFAADGLTALHLLATHDYDVVALDLMLPGVSGLEICRRIREDLNSQVPVIIMTAKGALSDKERGFGCGADDYLVKPFDLLELQLRVDVLLRRHLPPSRGLKAGSIHFDPDTLRVDLGEGRVAELGGIPARLFETLIRAYPRHVDHETLTSVIWGNGDIEAGASLRTHVYSLRQTLQKSLGHALVMTLHGRGYRLVAPEDERSGAPP